MLKNSHEISSKYRPFARRVLRAGIAASVLAAGLHCSGSSQPGAPATEEPVTDKSLLLHYGPHAVDVRTLIGMADFGLRGMVDEDTNDLYWVRNGHRSAEIVRVPFGPAGWEES